MDEIFRWPEKSNQFEWLTSQSMLGRKSTLKVGTFHMTPVLCRRYQGTHSIDCVSQIFLDLKNCFCKNELIHKMISKFSILQRITKGINKTMLKARFTIVAISTSFSPRFFLFMCSRQLPLPSCQFRKGNGKCDFWIAWTSFSHNVTVEGTFFSHNMSMMNMVKLWRRSIPIKARK